MFWKKCGNAGNYQICGISRTIAGWLTPMVKFIFVFKAAPYNTEGCTALRVYNGSSFTCALWVPANFHLQYLKTCSKPWLKHGRKHIQIQRYNVYQEWTGHRTNQSIAEELRVISGTLLNKNLYKFKKVTWLTPFVCYYVCQLLASFISHCQYNESVYRNEQHASWNIPIA